MFLTYLYNQLSNPSPAEVFFCVLFIVCVLYHAILDKRKNRNISKSGRNEIRKLQASFLNTVSLGIVAVGIIGPAVTGIFYRHTYFNYQIRDIYAITLASAVVVALQATAWDILRKLED